MEKFLFEMCTDKPSEEVQTTDRDDVTCSFCKELIHDDYNELNIHINDFTRIPDFTKIADITGYACHTYLE
jgi:hypothetical protein